MNNSEQAVKNINELAEASVQLINNLAANGCYIYKLIQIYTNMVFGFTEVQGINDILNNYLSQSTNNINLTDLNSVAAAQFQAINSILTNPAYIKAMSLQEQGFDFLPPFQS